MRKTHVILFTAALTISAALCWQAGLRLPTSDAQPTAMEDAFLSAISQAVTSPEDCETVLARVKRITAKAVKEHMPAK